MLVTHCTQTARDRQRRRNLVQFMISDPQHWGRNTTMTSLHVYTDASLTATTRWRSRHQLFRDLDVRPGQYFYWIWPGRRPTTGRDTCIPVSHYNYDLQPVADDQHSRWFSDCLQDFITARRRYCIPQICTTRCHWYWLIHSYAVDRASTVFSAVPFHVCTSNLRDAPTKIGEIVIIRICLFVCFIVKCS